MNISRLIVLAAVLAAASASAQTMRPGLWEQNNKITSGSGQATQAMAEAQKHFANMPPAQRKMIEDMMARQGVGLNVSGDGGVKVTYCLTKEMAERKELPTGQQGQCQSSNTPFPGGMDVKFSCTKPATSGTGRATFQGDAAYTMNMDVTTSANGAPEKMTVLSTGRWLGAQCGSKGSAN